MARHEGEDSQYLWRLAIPLETLAVKAFGDMGPHMDRFVAVHENCALWDIVDRCRVWESHADTGAQIIVNTGAGEGPTGIHGERTSVCAGSPGCGVVYCTSVRTRRLRGVAYFQLYQCRHRRPARYPQRWIFCWNV